MQDFLPINNQFVAIRNNKRERWFIHTSILHNVLGTRIEPTSFTSTNVKLRLRFDVLLTFT